MPPDGPETQLATCLPSEMSRKPSPSAETAPSTIVRQEPTTISPAGESSTEAFRTAEYPNGVLGLSEGEEPRHETVLRRASPTIGAIPHTSAQTVHTTALLADQSIAEASEMTNFLSEALDGHERPSKRRCDATPRFTCPLCSKSFTRRTTLNNHQRQHTGERPFRCGFSECGESFAQNNDKKRHEKIHRTERAFKCGGSRLDGSPWGCGTAFTRKDGLLEHHHRTAKGRQCLASRDGKSDSKVDR
jgi:hypothetical protein